MMEAALFKQKLAARAVTARVTVSDSELDKLTQYFDLLSRWNSRMNLTALPLEALSDQTIDRLFIEPLAAARWMPKSPIAWLDVGSGGGSPAIPLAVLRRQARLTMIESKGRKAAFLREVVRTLGLKGADVQNLRFEAFCPAHPDIAADLITVRAVRTDGELLALCRAALRLDGELFLFQSDEASDYTPDGFKRLRTVQLTDAPSFLAVLKAV